MKPAGAFRELGVFGIGMLCAWFMWGDTNTQMTYGPTGLPKNCRAIIDSNVNGMHDGRWDAAGALASISRNCGRFGYSWGQ